MKFIDQQTIQLDKVITELDAMVSKFIHILEKHMEYVLVSDYVAILFGRARATEDIDLFIRKLDKERFTLLYEELKHAGYWCLNAEDTERVYEYLGEEIAVRFAEEGKTIPNFEVKCALKKLDQASFSDALTVILPNGKLKVSSLERQLAFKRYFLKSEKDLEDARHLEEVFRNNIDPQKVEAYRRLIEHETS